MLIIEDLSSGYGETPILRGVSMHIRPGETVALMGRNGVGKTTLLKSIMGLLPAQSGRIRLAGHDVTDRPPDQRARLGLGYVPQGRDIFPYLTVEENLRLGLEAVGKRARTIPEGIFTLFPALKSMLSKKGGVLSGGEQQQLAIGRALVAEPKVLLLDEPTEGIQPSIVFEIGQAIRLLKEQKTIAILLVEQYLDFALRLADAYDMMEKGTIVEHGPISSISKESIKHYLTV